MHTKDGHLKMAMSNKYTKAMCSFVFVTYFLESQQFGVLFVHQYLHFVQELIVTVLWVSCECLKLTG